MEMRSEVSHMNDGYTRKKEWIEQLFGDDWHNIMYRHFDIRYLGLPAFEKPGGLVCWDGLRSFWALSTGDPA